MARRLRRKRLICIIFISLSVICFQIVQAQEYPTKPVTFVMPSGPGGSHDLTARAVTSVAANYLGQPIVILNKPGAGGAVASELVANAAPDGYTLLFGGPGHSSTLPAVEGRSRGPDDLLAVCRINYSPTTITARSDLPYRTFKEMLEWAKANPGKLIFGTTGTWGNADVAWRQIAKQTGVTARVVPYDGGSPLTIAILGNQIDVMGIVMAPIIPHIKSGKLRVLAVLDQKRVADLPDAPTAKEQGVDVVNILWRGVLAPKGTPRPIVDKLALAFKKMTEDKSVISTIKQQLGDEIYYQGPDEFAKFWRADYEAYRELAKLYKK